MLRVWALLQGLKGSIPANFPYFHVEFNLVKGFVHVIDDETKFDPQFGRSILIGLLGLPAEDMHRYRQNPATNLLFAFSFLCLEAAA